MNRRQKTAALAGFIVLAVSLVIFFLTTADRQRLDWICLSFILLAEIVMFGGLILVDRLAQCRGGALFRAGAVSILVICTVLSILFAMIFTVLFREHERLFVIAEILVFALSFLALLVLSASAKGVAEQDLVLDKAQTALQTVQLLADRLAREPANRPYLPQLTKVSEAIRFSDASRTSVKDQLIFQELAALEMVLNGREEGKVAETQRRTDELLSLIAQRNGEIKSSRQ